MIHLINLDYNTEASGSQPLTFSIKRKNTAEFKAILLLKKTGVKHTFDKNTNEFALGSPSSLVNSNAQLTVTFLGENQDAVLDIDLAGGQHKLSHQITITNPGSQKVIVDYAILFKSVV